jgi:hypothetical protein
MPPTVSATSPRSAVITSPAGAPVPPDPREAQTTATATRPAAIAASAAILVRDDVIGATLSGRF